MLLATIAALRACYFVADVAARVRNRIDQRRCTAAR
jgi:hypothetical protein